jgi:soluble lytic murein transglycosylase-like protein
MKQESGLHPCAASAKGVQGLMQLMRSAAEELQRSGPQQNIEAGAKYLKQLMNKYSGDIAQALGAYPRRSRYRRSGGEDPETRGYVDAILSRMGVKRTDPPSIQTPRPTEN